MRITILLEYLRITISTRNKKAAPATTKNGKATKKKQLKPFGEAAKPRLFSYLDINTLFENFQVVSLFFS